LLSLQSLRLDTIDNKFTHRDTVKEIRGPMPTYIELVILCYVAGI